MYVIALSFAHVHVILINPSVIAKFFFSAHFNSPIYTLYYGKTWERAEKEASEASWDNSLCLVSLYLENCLLNVPCFGVLTLKWSCYSRSVATATAGEPTSEVRGSVTC